MEVDVLIGFDDTLIVGIDVDMVVVVVEVWSTKLGGSDDIG